MLRYTRTFSLLLLLTALTHARSDSGINYTNKWATFIPGGHEIATQVAAEFGYENYGQVRQRFIIILFHFSTNVKNICFQVHEEEFVLIVLFFPHTIPARDNKCTGFSPHLAITKGNNL